MKSLNLILNNTLTLYIGKKVLITIRSLVLIGIQRSYSNRNEKIILKPLILKNLYLTKNVSLVKS